MKKIKEIPDDILEVISYLSHIYSKKIKHALCSKEDLYNDLVLFYCEKKDKISHINKWFVSFKNFLINKQKRAIIESRVYENYKREREL